jgi:hypothetical protein
MKFNGFNMSFIVAIAFLLIGCAAQQSPTFGGAHRPDMRVSIGMGNTWGSRSGVGFGMGTSVSFPIGNSARNRDQRELEEYRAYLQSIDLINQERAKKRQKPVEKMSFEQWRAARDQNTKVKSVR